MHKILLIGNKNVGKTTLYNIITNQNEKVANVSGSTVEIKTFEKKDHVLSDLPGIDGFLPTSKDEEIVIDYLSSSAYDQINLVLDSTNISKSSNLFIECLELEKPINLYLHQVDQLIKKDRLKQVFEKNLNLNVFLTTHKNSNDIKKNWYINAKNNSNFRLDYGNNLETLISKLEHYITPTKNFNSRFIAIQMILENDYFLNLVDSKTKLQVLNLILKYQKNSTFKLGRCIILARKMFCEKLLKQTTSEIKKQSKYEQIIDNILINPYLGPLIFLILVSLIYYTSIEVIGIPLQNLWVDNLESWGTNISTYLVSINTNTILISLFSDVIISSLGTIIGFVPMILSIYFFNSFLETTGYNYRTSILFDNLLSKFGLDGRSIVAIMCGFGCNVPAILTTRIQKSKIKRIISILVIPFIPCVARLPLISLFASIFFKSWHFLFVLLFNILIILITFLSSFILKQTKFKKSESTLFFEYPKLKLPNFIYIFKLSWKTSINYLNKIFTTLFIGAIIIWFLTKFGFDGFESKKPLITYFLPITSYIFKPFNINDQRFSGLLIVGFSVKELLISTIPILFQNDINTVITTNLNLAQAVSILLFFILYTPCLSTYLTIKKEIGIKYANFSIIFSLIIAYVSSYLIYIILSLFIK